MKLFFTGILISLFCVGIFAQQTATVTGRLKDLGQIVPNQTAKLVSATETFEARTDSDGNYRFDGVADGSGFDERRC